MSELTQTISTWPNKCDPAIVTFVSDGYEPILNNWLAWLKASGAALEDVIVIAARGNVQNVQRKLMYRSVRVIEMGPVELDQVTPGLSDDLGKKSDPVRHRRSR